MWVRVLRLWQDAACPAKENYLGFSHYINQSQLKTCFLRTGARQPCVLRNWGKHIPRPSARCGGALTCPWPSLGLIDSTFVGWRRPRTSRACLYHFWLHKNQIMAVSDKYWRWNIEWRPRKKFVQLMHRNLPKTTNDSSLKFVVVFFYFKKAALKICAAQPGQLMLTMLPTWAIQLKATCLTRCRS